jgi:hypothetical protein
MSSQRLARIAAAMVFAVLPATAPADAQVQAPPPIALAWTDWADLALAAPVVLAGTLTDVERASRKESADLPPGEGRAIVRAGLTAALKAPGLLPAEAAWRWEGAVDARRRPPFAPKAPVLVFGEPLSGGGNPAVQPLRLVARHGQQPWSPAAEAIVRDILRQAQALGKAGSGAQAPMVTGVADGFRTTGDVPGVSESQFFLTSADGVPLTLLVRRAPGTGPQVMVATGELVDRARPVAPRTLLWRGLACGLPGGLPAALAADAGLVSDYALARASIGACGRTVAAPGQSLESRIPTARASG